MGEVSVRAVKENQEKIVDIIRRLERTGEIAIEYGEMIK
jgi:flagellar motor switch protein FliG